MYSLCIRVYACVFAVVEPQVFCAENLNTLQRCFTTFHSGAHFTYTGIAYSNMSCGVCNKTTTLNRFIPEEYCTCATVISVATCIAECSIQCVYMIRGISPSTSDAVCRVQQLLSYTEQNIKCRVYIFNVNVSRRGNPIVRACPHTCARAVLVYTQAAGNTAARAVG